MTGQQTTTNAKETVLAFINALNAEDFTAAREYAQEDLTFVGVLGTRNGADAYFADMSRMKLKYDVKKVFVDGDDVCLLYDIAMGDKIIFSCGWYQLINNKINSFRVVFDPRPLLEQPAQ